jgi:hypothetical protein
MMFELLADWETAQPWSVVASRRRSCSGAPRALRRTSPTAAGALHRGAEAYAVYRAAEDRADAAEAELANLTVDTLILA